MFKKASQKDIKTIQDLAQKSWEHAYKNILAAEQIDYMLGLMYSEVAIAGHLANLNYHYYIILDDETPVGFVGFEINTEENTTKLHRIYFIREAHGKGFGRLALQFVIKQAAEAGDQRIILAVNKNNTAKQFYESQGFKLYDEGVFEIGNGFVMDDYLMEFIIPGI